MILRGRGLSPWMIISYKGAAVSAADKRHLACSPSFAGIMSRRSGWIMAFKDIENLEHDMRSNIEVGLRGDAFRSSIGQGCCKALCSFPLSSIRSFYFLIVSYLCKDSTGLKPCFSSPLFPSSSLILSFIPSSISSSLSHISGHLVPNESNSTNLYSGNQCHLSHHPAFISFHSFFLLAISLAYSEDPYTSSSHQCQRNSHQDYQKLLLLPLKSLLSILCKAEVASDTAGTTCSNQHAINERKAMLPKSARRSKNFERSSRADEVSRVTVRS